MFERPGEVEELQDTVVSDFVKGKTSLPTYGEQPTAHQARQMGRNPPLGEAYVVDALGTSPLLGGAELEKTESARVTKGTKQLCHQFLRTGSPGTHHVLPWNRDQGRHFGHDLILG